MCVGSDLGLLTWTLSHQQTKHGSMNSTLICVTGSVLGEMAFFFSARDDSHHIGARGEESGQVDAPDGVSQLMAERCTGESENAPTRDASAASAVASAGGLLEQSSGGVLLEGAAAGRGDEGKDGGAEHSSAEGKAHDGEEGADSPPPPPLSSRADAQPKKTVPLSSSYDGPADALCQSLIDMGRVERWKERWSERGRDGRFSGNPDTAVARITELLDAGIDVRYQDQHGRTALHLASLQGHAAAATEALIAADPSVEHLHSGISGIRGSGGSSGGRSPEAAIRSERC